MVEELRGLVSNRWGLRTGRILCPFFRAAGLPVSVETLGPSGIRTVVPLFPIPLLGFCGLFPLSLGSLVLPQSIEEDCIVLEKVWAHTVVGLCTRGFPRRSLAWPEFRQREASTGREEKSLLQLLLPQLALPQSLTCLPGYSVTPCFPALSWVWLGCREANYPVRTVEQLQASGRTDLSRNVTALRTKGSDNRVVLAHL